MFNVNKIIAVLVLLCMQMPVFAANTVQEAAPKASVQTSSSIKANALDIVASPSSYLNKQVIIEGKFDKFTTLGLDYKKAFRDSTKYIGFMLQRDNVVGHNVPLSEMKLFLKREYAEKFIELNTGDKIRITGKVFSNALGDVWIDVSVIEVIEKAPSDK